MADDDDDWETDPDYENTTNTDAARLAEKMAASKMLNDSYEKAGLRKDDEKEGEDELSEPGSNDQPSTSAEELAVPVAPLPNAEHEKQMPPPGPPAKPAAEKKKIAMQWTVKSQAKAPPTLPGGPRMGGLPPS